MSDVIKWIKKVFSSAKAHADKVAISITEAIKTVLDGKVINAIAEVLDHALHTHLGEDALKFLNIAVIRALAIELAIQGIPDSPTEDDVIKFESEVVKAITGLDPKGRSKFLTIFSAHVFGIITKAIGEDDNITFAEAVIIIEDCYQDYLIDLENSKAA